MSGEMNTRAAQAPVLVDVVADLTADLTAEHQRTSASSTSTWGDAASREALQLIAEGVTELAGFGVAAITVGREDEFEVVAVAGNAEAREQLLGSRATRESMLAELARADDWGLFKFVPHERLTDPDETFGWVPEFEPLEGEEAWHPLDMLVAPLVDTTGTMRGFLSIDLPEDGLRPSLGHRRLLDRYAGQAGRAVITALERESLAEQLRLATAARDVVRKASRELDIKTLLLDCQPALVSGFRSAGMWIHTVDEDGRGESALYSIIGAEVELPPQLVRIAERASRLAWAAQRVDIVSRDRHTGSDINDRELGQIMDFLEDLGVTSILFVPIGSGPEPLGSLVLTRRPVDPDWSEVEADVALQVGHDLGQAIMNARAYERERELVRELKALDNYKTQLISTLSHELKSPLTSILGNLELIEHLHEVPQPIEQGLAAVGRGAHRLVRVVDDLLLLAKVGDPANPVVPLPVDLRPIVEDVRNLTTAAATQRGVAVVVDLPETPVVALGDAIELDRIVSNLVGNAIKYTPTDGTVTVTLRREATEVVLTVADNGIGISAADRTRLFREFFRSTNPSALSEPGTGLGLAIVDRIVTRHQGRIEVHSVLGEGSTFVVHLPAG